VNPPIDVESATWSAGGRLDWWVKERRRGWSGTGEYVVLMDVNGGSELLIFARSDRTDAVARCHFRRKHALREPDGTNRDRPIGRPP
jgi:hypothetical protein